MEKITLKSITKAYGKNPPVIEDLNLGIEEGSFTVLLGPSGCGKSTVLRMIAGLEKTTAGDVLIDGVSVRDVEPGDRNIAMVFQNYALYPTMSVRDNIEFGLKNMKVGKDERNARINEVAEMVGLTEYLSRKPANLSGGQRQRVALARAIVKKPAVFLMDEPLSNLDANLRTQIRTDLIELHQRLRTTFVYVTHDQVEAMSMGTDIVLMDQGKIQQHDSPAEIYAHPANVFTARFIGSPPMNVVPAEAAHGQTPDFVSKVGFRPERSHIVRPGEKVGEDTVLIDGNMLAREMLGDQTQYKMETEKGTVFVKEFNDDLLDYGDHQIAVKLSDIACFGMQGRLVGFGLKKE